MNSSAIKDKPEVLCLGQMVLDCIIRDRKANPTRKNVYTAGSISLHPGGDALNEAVVLSQLGHRVRLGAVVGRDPAGQILSSFARDNGLMTDGLIEDPHLDTPIANLIVSEDGSRESINSPATMLGDFMPDVSLVRDAQVLSLASLFRAPLDRPESVIALVREAKRQNMIICADTKLPTFRRMNLEDIGEILPLIDYIFPNENEAAWMTGEKDFRKMADHIAGLGVKNVIIKAGKQGCFVRSRGGDFFHVEALPVKAVDSTGAGDNYVAGFISGLLHGLSLRECCDQATSCAAACVQRHGATSSYT